MVLAVVVLATPVVGYLLAPIVRGDGGQYRKWIDLGELDEFPEGQTRLAKYKNPDLESPGTARPTIFPAGYAAFREKNSRSSPSTARILDVRCAGSRSRDCSCVPVTAACITRTARAPPDRRRADLFEYPYKVEDGHLMIEAGQLPTLSDQRQPARRGATDVKASQDRRLVRAAAEDSAPSSARRWSIGCRAKSASWFYVFGSAALTVFILQIFTGIMLALIYVPSAGEAWNSLQYLNHGVTLGWFLRAVHGWGSNFMVAIVLIHMVQVALFGAYKFPRELTWIVGVFLLLMTLGMAFTGQVMRFDQDAYWGLGIGASICGRVPFIGAWVVHLLLGGPIIAGDTLSRFFAFHVFVIPGLLHRIRLRTPADGAEAGHQRVADAGPPGAPLDLRSGVRRDDAEGRRALRAGTRCGRT